MKSFSGLLGAACLLSISTAQLLRYSPSAQNKLSFTFAQAPTNATGSDGDIFFQISGPASNSWMAVGQGNSMKGSQIFVIYDNAAGTNVTLSSRLGSGHNEPAEEPGSGAILLAGSGIDNGTSTANILCKGCSSWRGGLMNLTGSAQQWIWATKAGNPIKSDSRSASIQQHDDGSFGSFRLDLNTMSTTNTTNPFLDLAAQNVIDVGAASSGYDGVGIPIHGIIMCLAFVIGFPLGAFLIRLASFRGLVWVHVSVQLLSYLGAIIGLGIGWYIINKGAADLSAFHPILGIAVTVLLISQPILGYVHHLRYKRYQVASPYTHVHVWFGRALVSAGLVNGLLGCVLAGKGVGTIVAYCIAAGGVWALWIVVVVCAAKRLKRSKVQRNDIRMAALLDERDERGEERYDES